MYKWHVINRGGESEHKVHAHIIPRSGRHEKWCVEARILPYLFGGGAHPTLSNDVHNIALQAWSVEPMLYHRNRFVTAKVAGKTPRMALPSEPISKRREWDAQPILIE